MFLNNRYHDPTTGTFISVDPLVATTGQAYLYTGGNPTTLSDPSGLHPCEATPSAGVCGPFGAENGPKDAGAAAAQLIAAVQDPSVTPEQVKSYNGVCQAAATLCRVGSSAGYLPDAWNLLSNAERATAQANFNVAQLMFLLLKASGELVRDPSGGWVYRQGAVVPELVLNGDRSGAVIALRDNSGPSFSIGITTGYCPLFCLEVGISGEGLYTRTGVGLAV